MHRRFHPEIDNRDPCGNSSRTRRRDEIIPSSGVESPSGDPPANFIFLLLIDAGRQSLPRDPSVPNLLVKRTLRPIALVKTACRGEK